MFLKLEIAREAPELDAQLRNPGKKFLGVGVGERILLRARAALRPGGRQGTLDAIEGILEELDRGFKPSPVEFMKFHRGLQSGGRCGGAVESRSVTCVIWSSTAIKRCIRSSIRAAASLVSGP